MIVVGDREVEQERIAVRSLGGEDLGSIAVQEFVQIVQQ
jgi:threonyl-tRNA synthetase